MKRKYLLSVTAILLAMTLLFRLSNAQQVATEILDDVVIDRIDYNAVIKVEFKRLFRYISHSPTSTGRTINVRIDIPDINLPSIGPLVDNESIPIKNDKNTGLREVVYERDGRNSSYLIFYFDKDVSFEVVQGSDQRSLSVIVYGLK